MGFKVQKLPADRLKGLINCRVWHLKVSNFLISWWQVKKVQQGKCFSSKQPLVALKDMVTVMVLKLRFVQKEKLISKA